MNLTWSPPCLIKKYFRPEDSLTSPSSSSELSALDFNEHPSDSTQAAAGYYICCGTDLIAWLDYYAKIPGISVIILI